METTNTKSCCGPSCCEGGVINLSTDKDEVLGEAFRVLPPGGRFAVSEIAVRRELPSDVKKSMALDGAMMSAFTRAKKPLAS